MADLHDSEVAVEFYENRYEDGYMEDWDEAKKSKVFSLLRTLELLPTGIALDFGCGNGVFTNIIKKALPGWEVYGVEISSTAVKNASSKFPECHFFLSTDADQYLGKFDLLFSHHVIEHVQDVGETFSLINQYLKPKALQFHVLPCGNPGSLEYHICELRRDGFRENGLFFFEEPGHLQRLNTESFINFERAIGFELKADWYANQRDGAIDWITKSSPRFVKRLTESGNAVSAAARNELEDLRKQLLPLTYKQFAYSKYLMIKSQWKKSLADKIKLAALSIPAMISKRLYEGVEQKAKAEWEERQKDLHGSETFLFFKREAV